AGGQRRDLEVIRERLQGRDVRLGRPAAIRIGANDADANSFGSILGHGGVSFSLVSIPAVKLDWVADYLISQKKALPMPNFYESAPNSGGAADVLRAKILQESAARWPASLL